MRLEEFNPDMQATLMPTHQARLIYRCLNCQKEFAIDELLYVCPDCGHVLLIYDKNFGNLLKTPGHVWRRVFDFRRMLNLPALKGIYRYHEFIGPIIPLDDVIYLGEGHTPIVEANAALQKIAGGRFYYKNDGQNPSASFKDRGMASALSYINHLVKAGKLDEVLAVCASTGDTSAAAALYASYLDGKVKSAVLLPHKKVTPQQLSQPLGNGAKVFEIPGVFDDCMKIVENLSENYNVALLNSKNPWRILGQESYSYEIAQDLEYDVENVAVFVPIGNAGNISAVMSGFLKWLEAGIIEKLPKIVGVQSTHADPVYKYYAAPPDCRKFEAVAVRSSVAQAAMIGNPVSMPRVIHLVNLYNAKAGQERVFFVEVKEQDIMDWQLTANRHGHIACTHGGETLAGFVRALELGLVAENEVAVLDSTAHALKFAGFQEMYFEDKFPPEYEVVPRTELINAPEYVTPAPGIPVPTSAEPLIGTELTTFVTETARVIAKKLDLKGR